MTTLWVAAGGGGDALAALILRRLLADTTQPPLVATYAWERLRVDPSPGPRPASGFVGLGIVGDRPVEILATSDTTPPGRSFLPRLGRETGARLFLLDPSAGAVGMRADLALLVETQDADRIVVVDVGGDVVAQGDEPGLRSPLADALAVAACNGLRVPVTVAVAGVGLDGELTAAEATASLRQFEATNLGGIEPSDVEPYREVLTWHPTEATALLCAAADGVQGIADLRAGAGFAVPVTSESAQVWTFPAQALVAHRQLPRDLRNTVSLDTAEEVARRVASSEIDFERRRANQARRFDPLVAQDIPRLCSAYAREALARGVTLATTRTIAEALGLPGSQTPDLRTYLASRPGASAGAVWSVAALTAQPVASAGPVGVHCCRGDDA